MSPYPAAPKRTSCLASNGDSAPVNLIDVAESGMFRN